MTDHPDHPVRKYDQFVMLRYLNRHVPSMSWGVKLHMTKGKSLRPNFVKWTYGPTAKGALDAALAHLVEMALHDS